jgi:2-amino-4-hydroxy-6-hydroxymethyldihydropteridine diphosphokinase
MGCPAAAWPLRHAGRAGTEVRSEARSPKSEVQVFVALGSNLGDSASTLRQAMDRLEGLSEKPLIRSSLWRSAPVDCPPGSPPFVNAVVGLRPRPDETPEKLLGRLQQLEREFGRQPKVLSNEPRPLDLDLLAFGCERRTSDDLTLPHPRAHLRRFVLAPWAEIAPGFAIPGQSMTVAALLSGLGGGELVDRIRTGERGVRVGEGHSS